MKTPPRWLRPPPFLMRALRMLPLRLRGALFILCGLALVFAVFGGFAAHNTRVAGAAVRAELERAAQVTAVRIDHHLAHLQAGVQRVATWPGLARSLELIEAGRTDVAPPWVALHYITVDEHGAPDAVFVTGRDGVVLWTKPPGLGLLNRAMGEYGGLRRVLDGGALQVGDLHTDEFWPDPHILVAASIRNERQEVVGTVGAIIGSAWLKDGDFFRELNGVVTEEGLTNAYVVDADGSVVSSAGTVLPDEHAATLDEPDRSRGPSSVRREDGIVAAHPLSVAGWRVVVTLPGAAVYGNAARTGIILAVAGFLITVVALIVWVPFVASFIDPVGGLEEHSRRIAAGDLSWPIPIDGHDEITRLAQSLDHMRRQLAVDQHRLKEQVVQLNEINRLKTEFIATLSHELRTPLHIMYGYLGLVLEGAFGAVPEAIREPLAVTARQYDGLRNLIESCLTLVSIDAGKEPIALAETDLCGLVRTLADDYRQPARDKGLSFRTTLPDSACRIVTDPLRVRRILSNLLNNALKFTDRGEIEASIDVRQGSDVVAVSVRDTGVGIAIAERAYIFERFRQGDGSATRRFDGVGLGLSIARELAIPIGGRIVVESEPGVGSVFTLELRAGGPDSFYLQPRATSQAGIN